MSFFDSYKQQQTQSQQQNMNAELGNIKSNPGAYLKSRGFNIPEGMNDPRQITQYLLRTGQVGNGRLQQVMRMIGMPGMR